MIFIQGMNQSFLPAFLIPLLFLLLCFRQLLRSIGMEDPKVKTVSLSLSHFLFFIE
jgi:hypothetical protein